MAQRALLVAHDHCTPPGLVAERLEHHGYTVTPLLVVPEKDFANPGIEAHFPPARDFDLIVILGSYWSAWDDELIGSWLHPEMQLLRDADAAGIPVLGICFGGQVLARTHGGSVAPAPEPEIGFIEIASDRPELAAGGRWFAWHYDRWQMPPDATEFARNSMASQGFTLRQNMAIQFHPEVTAEVLTGWIDNGGREMLAARGQDADELIAEAAKWDGTGRERAFAVIDGFIEHITKRAAA